MSKCHVTRRTLVVPVQSTDRLTILMVWIRTKQMTHDSVVECTAYFLHSLLWVHSDTRLSPSLTSLDLDNVRVDPRRTLGPVYRPRTYFFIVTAPRLRPYTRADTLPPLLHTLNSPFMPPSRASALLTIQCRTAETDAFVPHPAAPLDADQTKNDWSVT